VVPVAAGPGDQSAADAAARGYLRASRADREHVIDVLKAAFAQGRLDRDEFDLRVGQAFASRTYAELAAVTAGLTAAKPPAPARAQGEQPVLRRPGLVITTATAVYACAWAYELLLSPRGDDNQVIFGGGLLYLIVLALCAGQMVAFRREKRSGGQLPPRPAQSGPELGGERDGGPGDDLLLCQVHRATRARRLLGHSVSQRIWRVSPG
jgi:hypothetical protein